MRPPPCPACHRGMRFVTDDIGAVSELCDTCGFSRRITPLARAPFKNVDVRTATCDVIGCDTVFEYVHKHRQSKIPETCPAHLRERRLARGARQRALRRVA